MATDIYGEGVRIPPIHLVRGGEICSDVMKLILANVRSSKERQADFEAQIGSLKTGRRTPARDCRAPRSKGSAPSMLNT